MELDLLSLFGLHVHSCNNLAATPKHPPPPPRIWALLMGGLLVSQDRRHLFVTPW